MALELKELLMRRGPLTKFATGGLGSGATLSDGRMWLAERRQTV